MGFEADESSPGGVGTVTSFSFTDANGFSGTVTNPTTNPNLTLDALAFASLTSKPTTIAGYGITDGVTLTGLEALSNKTGLISQWTNDAGYLTSASGVTSVSGTSNRITSSGGATPVIDISAVYVGQTSITTLGTVATGTWGATTIAIAKGGTNSTSQVTNGVNYFDGTSIKSLATFLFDGTNMGIGATPDSILTVSKQTTIVAPVSGTTVHFIGLDANPLRVTLDTHDNTNAGGTAFLFRKSRGTAASPGAVQSGDTLGTINATGYGTSQYGAASTGLASFKANQAFTNTAMGTYWTVFTTPDNSVTAAEALRITGAGAINAFQTAGVFQINGTTVLNTTTLGSGVTASSLTSFGNSPTIVTPTITTSAIIPLIYGGTAAGSTISYTSTTGTGTTTGAAHIFAGGTNGATNIGTFYNDGQVLFGTTTRNPSAGPIGIFRIGQGTSTIDMGEQSSGVAGIWFSMTTPSSSNYSMRGTSTITYVNSATSTGDVQLSYAGTTRYTFSGRSIALAPNTFSSGVTAGFTFTGAASTAQTASTESTTVNWDLTATLQHATGALATQRDFRIQARTHSAVAASTITDAATLSISGAPIAGTNATITNTHGLLINANAVGTSTNSYGLTVNAQTGSTNNYAAQFLGGTVVLAAGTTTVGPLKFLSGTNLTTAVAGTLEYNGTNFFGTRTGTTRETIMTNVDSTAPATNNIGVIFDYYGTSATRVMTTPNGWIGFQDGATLKKIPYYT